MEKTYHTIVIGAGPAGLNAARFLKQKTLVLDKKSSVGHPVQCGEGVSISALSREGLEPNDRWKACCIRRIKRIMPNGKYIGERHADPYAVVLRRERFEAHLAGMVPWEIRMNAHVTNIQQRDGLFVVETATGDRLYAERLIGADGPNSIVAKKVFQYRPACAPAVNYGVNFASSILSDELHMYFGSHIAPSGYGWLFPTSSHSANVGLLMKEKGNLGNRFTYFTDTVIKPLFGDFQRVKNKSGVLPVSGFYQSISKGDAFLAGDAGAFTDPIFEGGINMALLTGRLCAEGINMDDPGYYQKCIDDLPFSGSDLVDARRIFYGFPDAVLNDLGDVIDGNSTAYLETEAGRRAFSAKPNLVSRQAEIASFARTWRMAKPYIW
ncbi:MAG: NAD(P)/FAD-dependent oxidoreductase [Desulfobacterales bacterium]